MRWSDGSNLEAKSPPGERPSSVLLAEDTPRGTCTDFQLHYVAGATAFIDCVAMYNALTPEQKKWVDNSLVAYPAQPCEFEATFALVGLHPKLICSIALSLYFSQTQTNGFTAPNATVSVFACSTRARNTTLKMPTLLSLKRSLLWVFALFPCPIPR